MRGTGPRYPRISKVPLELKYEQKKKTSIRALVSKFRDLLLYPFNMTTNYHSDYSYGTTTSYGKAYKKTYTNAALKKEIKAGFTEELRIGQKWHVIPMDWFDKWKLYINYDNDSNEVKNLQ